MTRTPGQSAIVEAVRAADGVIFAAPAYHGNVSSLVKNAIDLLDGLRHDARRHLDGRAVGCIVTGEGWQASGATLAALRACVHALGGWPTPLGVDLDTKTPLFAATGTCSDARVREQLATLGRQVVEFAIGRQLLDAASPPRQSAAGASRPRTAAARRPCSSGRSDRRGSRSWPAGS